MRLLTTSTFPLNALFTAAFLAALLLLGNGLQAASYTWIPTTSGTWNDAANWGGVAG